MRPVRIRCAPHVIEAFTNAAITTFPCERYAVLLGSRRGNSVVIRDVWFPDGQRNTPTAAESLRSRKTWLADAEAISESEGCEIVGDIHSHTFKRRRDMHDRAPSEADWKESEGTPWITGICVVYRPKRGPAETSIRFWPWIQRVKLEK